MTTEPTGRRGEDARIDPSDAERAGETPPHADAEKMESALREAGPLVDDSEIEQARRVQATEPGPGTSLT